VALAAIVAPLRAAEIDSLTDRQRPLRDATDALEQRLNRALRAGIAQANLGAAACDEVALYDAVSEAFSSPFIGQWIAETLGEDEALDRRRVLRADSIYRDLGVLDNVSVHVRDLSAVVRVDDALVGVDKFGHFLVEGWDYFETAVLDGEGALGAMDWGEKSERTYFGSLTTGVYSHADLVANFEGMRFWLRLVGRAPDPLEAGRHANRPYAVCRRRFWIAGERAWHLAREIDLDNYVSPMWDEAVNCPRYRTPEIEASVSARVAALSTRDGVDYSCPLDARACVEARERYGELAPRLLHPACLNAQQAAHPWWRFW